MLHSRRHVMDSAGRRAALLALLLLGAIPAAAQARTYEVDGRVTGPPTTSLHCISSVPKPARLSLN